ncbi:MAG TPA: hypothetical protein VF188_17610 [Longimicrobiales bacterium]
MRNRAEPAAPVARRVLRVGDRLPALEMTDERSGARVQWRAPARGAPVVVFTGPIEAGDGARYLESLSAAAPALALWGGRPIVVVPGIEAARAAAEAAPSFPILVDGDGAAARRCGVAAGRAALLIADRWGQIYDATYADSTRDLPDAGAIEEWLRFIATQCPECGVPDEPGRGEWTR